MNTITFKQQALLILPEYQDICKTFTRKLLVSGRSSSCVEDYLLQISKMVIYFRRSPIELSNTEIEEYLVEIQKNYSPSMSSYKHLICGLRHLFRFYKKKELLITLPSIRHAKTLPVVLSKEEVKMLLKQPQSLKKRIILGTIYDSGIRISEAINLLISDVDLYRKTIHVRQSKFKKDRYVPISELLVRGIKKYIQESNPTYYLFNGQKEYKPMSSTSIQRIMKDALKTSNIIKNASIHSLRHSYATHLLEDGLDIVSLKNQLGHADIKNTMMYIHIARISPQLGFSPLKNLYETKIY